MSTVHNCIFSWKSIYCYVMWEVHVQRFNFASSALHVCIYPVIFCHQFFWLYIPKKFLQISTMCNSDTRQKWIVMWFVIWFFMCFGRAETVHDNHQSSYWEHVVHIYATCQCSIILETVICSNSVTLFDLWFRCSFVLSICSTVDEKHFCQICSSSNMSKNYTHNKMYMSCDFYVICVSNLYFL